MSEITSLGISLTVCTLVIVLCIALAGIFMADSARKTANEAKHEALTAQSIAESIIRRVGVQKKPRETAIALSDLSDLQK